MKSRMNKMQKTLERKNEKTRYYESLYETVLKVPKAHDK